MLVRTRVALWEFAAVVATGLFGISGGTALAGPAGPPQAEYVAGEVLVKFAGAPPVAVAKALAAADPVAARTLAARRETGALGKGAMFQTMAGLQLAKRREWQARAAQNTSGSQVASGGAGAALSIPGNPKQSAAAPSGSTAPSSRPAPSVAGVADVLARNGFVAAESLDLVGKPGNSTGGPKSPYARPSNSLSATSGASASSALNPSTKGQSGPTGPIDPSVYRLLLAPGADIPAVADQLMAAPGVAYAEPNWVGSLCAVPTDPLYPQQAADLALIGVEQAWAVQAGCEGTSQPLRVAVIDSGVDAAHRDLADALDLADSWNFVDGDAHVFDDVGHGTRVAGIIGAVAGNGEGIAGIAHGCRILSLDVADSAGVITSARVAQAVQWAAAHDARVANMSLRFSGFSQTLSDACDVADAGGVVLVAAAGNENQGDQPVYPASYAPVIGVGALMDDGATRAPWSNFNGLQTNLVDLVAPGSTVFSTIPGSQYNGNFGSGTSFAAPMVAATAASLATKYPVQSAPALRQHLLATAAPVAGGFQPLNSAGSGRLDARAALETPMVPRLSVVAVTVDDNTSYSAANDGDGALDKGETARIVVTLANAGADAVVVTGVLSCSSADIGPHRPRRRRLRPHRQRRQPFECGRPLFHHHRQRNRAGADSDVHARASRRRCAPARAGVQTAHRERFRRLRHQDQPDLCGRQDPPRDG